MDSSNAQNCFATELAQVRLETTGTIELVQFIRPEELDPLLAETPYYLGPDGPVAEEGFAVMVDALGRSGHVGIGRVVLSGKERLLALKPTGKGFVFFTLRPIAEVRAAHCFDDLVERTPEQAQVALAQKLIESKAAPFDPAAFTDRYHTALLELIKAKIAGSEPVVMPQHQTALVINFLDALRQSIAIDQAPTPPKNGKPANGKVLKLAALSKRGKAKQPAAINLPPSRALDVAK